MSLPVVARQRQLLLVITGGLALIVTMFAWAVGSPPASGPDERFHYGFIWCPDDNVSDTCLGVRDEGSGELRVRYAVPDYGCFIGQPERPAKCSDGTDSSETVIFRGAYPAGYYSFASRFVSEDAEASVLRIRLVNSVLASTMIAATVLLTSGRLRRALIVATMLFLGPLHLSLLSSTHHQSWTISALATGWALILVVVDPSAGRRRWYSLGLWLVGLAIASSSRWEGGPYFVYSSLMAVVPLATSRFGRMRKGRVAVLVAAAVLLLSQIPNWPFSIRRWVSGVNTTPLNSDGPDVFTWLTSWLLHFPTVIFEVFGGGGMSTDDIPIPSLGPTLGPLFLGGVCAFALTVAGRVQIGTAVVQLAVILLSILYFTNIELDLLTLPGRYVTPLVSALIGLIVYQSRAERQFTDHAFLRRAMVVSLVVFHAVALHSYVERFVVGSRPSLVRLELTTESWWWDRVPVGPNQVILIGSSFFAVFVFALSRLLDESPRDTQAGLITQ